MCVPKNGAGDEARTRYLHLGKVALYRMSYTRIGIGCQPSEPNLFDSSDSDLHGADRRNRISSIPTIRIYMVPTVGTESLRFQRFGFIWCLRSESNQRHADFQSAALPTELQRHLAQEAQTRGMRNMATRNGLEPSTSSVKGWRANRLHHRAR